MGWRVGVVGLPGDGVGLAGFAAPLFGLKSAQLTSLAVIVIGLALFVWVGMKGEKISVRKY